MNFENNNQIPQINYIFPQLNIKYKVSFFFKIFILFQIVAIFVVLIFYFPFESIFFSNKLLKHYNFSSKDLNRVENLKVQINKYKDLKFYCNNNNQLIIQSTNEAALSFDKKILYCNQNIRDLFL